MKSTIDTLHAKLDELYSLMTPWGNDGERSTLHDATTAEDIARAEQRFGCAFPPSYKQFLRLHSAWEHFWGDATLIGIGAPETQTAQDKIAEYIAWQKDLLNDELGSEPSAEQVAAWESEKERHLYLQNHLVIGFQPGGALWVYDRRTRRADGEMKLTFWEMSYGAQEPAFDTFDQFLASWIPEVDFRIAYATPHPRKPKKKQKKITSRKRPASKAKTKTMNKKATRK